MVHVKLTSETGTRPGIAKVEVYDGDTLVIRVSAHVEQHQGIDGGYYPTIILTEEKR